MSHTNTASGNEVTAGSQTGSGTLDVVLFDTDNFVQDADVTLELTVTSGAVAPPTSSPRPDIAANNPLFEVYDPYMDNTSQGTTINLSTVQENVDKGEANWDGPSDVPNIIVVPDVGFVAPAEGETITADYPEFDDYYQNVDDGAVDPDPAFADWYSP